MKRCLNVGSGVFPRDSTKDEEWINLDVSYFPKVDILKDVSRGIPMDADTFDYVFMGDVIEHLDGEEIENTFRDLWRVCKHGATIEILTPHYTHPSSWGDFTHKQHFSEWTWERLQAKKINVPGGKSFVMWQFILDFLEVKNGRITVKYKVHKEGKYNPIRIKWGDKNEK